MFDERTEAGAAMLHDGAIARIRGTLAASDQADCIACGDPIAPARRAALPSARRCLGCQQALESRAR